MRGIPPEFRADLVDWLKKLPGSLLASSGTDKYYSLTSGVILLFEIALWGAIEFYLYRKKVFEQIAQERQRRLEIERQIASEKQERVEKEKQQALIEAERLRQELTKREEEISTLITQREKVLAKSEIIQYQAQQQARHLEDEIIQTKSKLQQSQQKYELELAEKLRDKAKTEEMLLTQEQIIDQLQQKQQEKVQISEQLHSELAEAQSRLEELHQDLSEEIEFVTKIQEQNVSNKEAYQQEIYFKELAFKQAQEELIKTRIHNEKQKQLLDKLRLNKNEIEQKYQALNEKLESNIEKLQQELRKSKTELIEQENIQEYLKLLEDENKQFSQEIENLKSKIDKLEKSKFDEQSRYKILEAEYRKYQQFYHDLKEKITVYREKEINRLDLSSKKIAFIGGDKRVIERIIKDLKSDFNLNKCSEIFPSWEKKMDLFSVKSKIINADFIFHFTARSKHDSQNILRELKHNISGQIIQVNSDGYSGAIREILEYLAVQI